MSQTALLEPPHSAVAAKSANGLRVAYLVNQYPQTSHSFIRREIAGLEDRGVTVSRYTIRRSSTPLVDEDDIAESQRTRALLEAGARGMLWATLHCLLTRPKRFLRALPLVWRCGRGSDRGLLLNGIYFTEACVLLRWLARDRVDHLHAHFGTNSATVAMYCRALGGPAFSFTVHGPEEFDRSAALKLPEKIARAAFVLAVSRFGRSQLCRWCDYSQWPKLHVVRCGVDSSFLGAPPLPIPAAPRLVCIARLHEQKGLPVLIDATHRLRQWGIRFELTIVGDGPLRGELEWQIARLQLNDAVRLAGWKSGREVREELLRARALVLPSFAEGLPVVIMEALALGRPVISTYVAGIPELVEPGVTGWLVPAGSPEPTARAMREALTLSPDELETLGANGAARVARQHDSRREATALLEILKSRTPADLP